MKTSRDSRRVGCHVLLAFPWQLEEQGQCWPLVRQRQQRHRQC
nr:MAG TPA: Protein of unknown function (DUF2630) [Caudoviricetes sp.]